MLQRVNYYVSGSNFLPINECRNHANVYNETNPMKAMEKMKGGREVGVRIQYGNREGE
jgi:hypothetical protein